MTKKMIEIHNNNTNESGYLHIYINYNGEKISFKIPENDIWSYLNMRQKEDFFIGKYKFKIPEYDIRQMINKYYYPATNATIIDAFNRYLENK